MKDPQIPSSDGPSEAGRLQYPGFGHLFLIWTAIGLLTSLRYQFHRPSYGDIGELSFIAAFTASYYPWIGLTALIFRIEEKLPLGNGKWPRNLILLAILSVPVCLLASPVMAGFLAAVLAVIEPASMPPAPRSLLRFFPSAEVLFWSSTFGGYFFRTRFQLREQEQKAARLALEKSQLEAGLKQAQLNALRARLNPHFLFNSLQNISVMTKQDPQTASRMLTRLGDLLRAVLRQDSAPQCTLRDEIELTQAYAAIEQMRFGDRLRVDFDIAPEALGAMVPCFVLQPLIENAVIHGLRGVRNNGRIDVSATTAQGGLVLTVSDNGEGPPGEDLEGIRLGVGLGATRERLATMYQDRQSLTMRRLPQGGTEVRIALPLQFSGNEDSVSHDGYSATTDRR